MISRINLYYVLLNFYVYSYFDYSFKINITMNSNQFYEPDLELAEALNSLFFEIILPSLIILGYFATKKKVKAVIVNNFEYRWLLVSL